MSVEINPDVIYLQYITFFYSLSLTHFIFYMETNNVCIRTKVLSMICFLFLVSKL